MAEAPFKALLVEGTSGVGKSTLIDQLIRFHIGRARPRKIRSLVHLAQSHTYGPLAPGEDKGTLRSEENMRHLERIVSGIEWLHAGVQGNKKPWCFVVLDTLHLTHCVRPGVVRWFEVESFDRRLAAVGCKLLFLRASTCAIEERGIAPRRNEQFLLQYAGKFGQSEEEIHAYFVREQETLSELFSRSAMRKVIVEDEGALQPQVDKIYEFWMES